MSFLFKNKNNNNNGVEKIGFEEVSNDDKLVRRATRFRILNTIIIYNSEDDFYETLATCVNEYNAIETISIEAFDISENVIELKGAYIDYQEYEEDSEVNCTGRIYYI
ncbi:hypothetical protein G9F72_010620 [Clostridium estertheticum]|uniref:hypothetical protein n=1 Tax=Clostridium estertheticum TaxID=238834 RepID=UPI0013E9424B|nr:hypothetical protein [Clostridium estertheticum]MBZ9686778.1 hypothetical protein [Clostridium estertheticum]